MSNQALKSKRNLKIHDYDKRIKQTINLLQNEPSVSKHSMSLIEKYHRAMITETLSKATISKHIQTLGSLCRMIDVEWRDATKSDLDKLTANIIGKYADDSGQETHTSRDHKKILKIFFRWFKLGSRSFTKVGNPPEIRDVVLKNVKDHIIREDLITKDDISRLLYSCEENQRDRAFLHTHYEAGTRPSEILNLKIKHLKFDNYGAVIHVDGKTGPRTIRLIKCVPDLSSWFNAHPQRDTSEAPLWINLGNSKEEYLTYAGACRLLTRRLKKAHITKRINLNLFRHSEATESAQFMTEAQMRKRHGWNPYSKMPGRYVHMTNQDVEDAIFNHYGIKTIKEKDTTLPKICNICEMPNSSDNEICSKCGKPLDLQTALAKEEQSQKDKEEQKQKMEEVDFRLLQLQQEVGILRKGAKSDDKALRTANTILYKNQKKIPGLSMKRGNPKYFVKDKDIEKNYNKIYDIDSYAFDREDKLDKTENKSE